VRQVVIPATFDEIIRIVDEMPERLKLFIVLAAFVGLREGELMELRRSDVDGLTGRISVTRKVDKDADPSVRGACPECGRFISTPKTKSGVRIVHVPPPFMPMLQTHLVELIELVEHGRRAAAVQVNATLTMTYWLVGRAVSIHALRYGRADYGKQIVASVGRQLSDRFGPGFGRSNLARMVSFARTYPVYDETLALAHRLTWTTFEICYTSLDASALDALSATPLEGEATNHRRCPGNDDNSSASHHHSRDKGLKDQRVFAAVIVIAIVIVIVIERTKFFSQHPMEIRGQVSELLVIVVMQKKLPLRFPIPFFERGILLQLRQEKID
jgi:hypothetical protein